MELLSIVSTIIIAYILDIINLFLFTHVTKGPRISVYSTKFTLENFQTASILHIRYSETEKNSKEMLECYTERVVS